MDLESSMLEDLSFATLKQVAMNMNVKVRRSRTDLLADIHKEINHHRRGKYIIGKQLGTPGKEGITYLATTSNGEEFAVKTFRKGKSVDRMCREARLQEMASSEGAAPSIVDIDTEAKRICMEKMDRHLLHVMEKQGNCLTLVQQKQIVKLYKALDKSKVFHGDVNVYNYMYRGRRLYMIDYGIAKEIDKSLIRELGTKTPNLDIMTLGLVLKLKEMGYSPSSYELLKMYIGPKHIARFKI
jgi:RIO-like serine/threonine protein kinase